MEYQSVIEQTLKSFINEAVRDAIGNAPAQAPEYISIKEAAEIAGCDDSVLQSLVKDRAATGFPATVLGPKTIRVNKILLIRWLDAGGLAAGKTQLKLVA